MAITQAAKNKAIRQKALREQLAAKGHIQKVIKDVEEIRELARLKIEDFADVESFLAEFTIAKDRVAMLKVAIDAQMRLVNKYLPDIKQQDITFKDDEKEVKELGEVIADLSPTEAGKVYAQIMQSSDDS